VVYHRKTKLSTHIAIGFMSNKLVRFTEERGWMLKIGIVEHGGRASPPQLRYWYTEGCDSL